MPIVIKEYVLDPKNIIFITKMYVLKKRKTGENTKMGFLVVHEMSYANFKGNRNTVLELILKTLGNINFF